MDPKILVLDSSTIKLLEQMLSKKNYLETPITL